MWPKNVISDFLCEIIPIWWLLDRWNLGLMSSSRSGTISSSSTSPLKRMMSISEYFIPLTKTGISLGKWGWRASLQTGSSANVSQNSQASRLELKNNSSKYYVCFGVQFWSQLWKLSLMEIKLILVTTVISNSF